MKGIILKLALFVGLPGVVMAQNGPLPVPSDGVRDAVVMQTHIPTKKVIPYAHLREADYVWSKKVWRTIDLREKQNYPLYYPLQPLNDRWNLFDILKGAILSGDLTAYKPLDEDKFLVSGIVDGDLLRYPVVPNSAQGMADPEYQAQITKLFNDVKDLGEQPIVLDVDPYGNEIYEYDANGDIAYERIADTTEVLAQDVIEYHIKEEWFFDKQRSVLDQRILAIAPVRYIMENGTPTAKREMFWVYFPEARYILQNFFVYNEHNDAMRMSFDDLFWKRKFQSYIDKQTNIYDREINDHKVGVDALLESDAIKYDIFKTEHDLWHF